MAFIYERQNHAALPFRPPSSSETSESRYFETFGLINYEQYDGPPSKYSLQRLTSSKQAPCSSQDAEGEVADWLVKELDISSRRVVTNQALKLKPNIDPQNISEHKRPDVMIMSDEAEPTTLVQIEVDSGKSWENTMRKLAHGLAHQLTSLRNWDDTTNKVSGFYFPFRKQECVVRVEVTWSDMELCFEEEHFNLVDPSEVGGIVCSVWKDAEDLKARCNGVHNNFSIPLTRDFIRHEFGEDVFQISSREAVVLVDPTKRKVYKHPLSDRVRDLLRDLMDHAENKKITLSRSEPPRTIKWVGSKKYFEFNLLGNPLSKRKAKEHITKFLASVIEAVEELHNLDNPIAHLDIRLDNICTDENDKAVLIDFDRMQYFSTSYKYGSYRSVMYRVPGGKKWTAKQVDWRQVGIMIVYILTDHLYIYHEQIPRYRHPFIKKLIEEGEN